jgi:hypothetical protein
MLKAKVDMENDGTAFRYHGDTLWSLKVLERR